MRFTHSSASVADQIKINSSTAVATESDCGITKRPGLVAPAMNSEIRIRLKAHSHRWEGSCHQPARIDELLIEHRVLLPASLTHRLELGFGFF